MLSAVEIIAKKRDGGALSAADIDAFVRGLVDGSWSDSQAAALAMAIVLRGMNETETTQLTTAMTRSGEQLDWSDAGLAGPVVDKHSTGGVGDKVSLLLAPMLAACGAVVPMISGRGLAHSGGTLDKLESLPGYTVDVDRARLLATLRGAGCAIVGASATMASADRRLASATLAPADRRLYAIRDVTATVESLPLITASILSKKLAAGLQSLVLDVKLGSGAFMRELGAARELAVSLVRVARGAGLPAVALITDMNQVLGATAGNALEVREAIDLLTFQVSADAGAARQQQRLLDLTLALGAEALMLAGLCMDAGTARQRLHDALRSGAAAERFARMVALLGGPVDVLRDAQLPQAPVQRALVAPRDGFIATVDTRAVGMAVVALGGGRLRAGDKVDPRVGLSNILPLGSQLRAGQALLQIHAATDADADAAEQRLLAAISIADEAPAAQPLIVERHA